MQGACIISQKVDPISSLLIKQHCSFFTNFKTPQTGFKAICSPWHELSNKVLITQCTYLSHVIKVALCVEMPRPTICFISIPAAKNEDR